MRVWELVKLNDRTGIWALKWIISQILPFLSSNIPSSPAYGVFISQLIRYARACSLYGCFILSATRLSNKLLEQGYAKECLKSSLRKFFGRYGDLIKQYEVSLSQMLNDILWPDHIQWQSPSDQTLYRTRPFPNFWEVSIEHLRRVWHADRGCLLLWTPGPVPLGLAYVLLVDTNPFYELVFIYMDYALRISLGTFSILLIKKGWKIWLHCMTNAIYQQKIHTMEATTQMPPKRSITQRLSTDLRIGVTAAIKQNNVVFRNILL